jgi:hypothetical protein
MLSHRTHFSTAFTPGALLTTLLATVAAVPAAATGTARAAAKDACMFLRATELSTLLGAPVANGELHEAGEVAADERFPHGTWASTCLWRSGAIGERASYVLLTVMQWPTGSRAARRFLDSFIDAAKDGTIDRTPVPLAIGEGGLWWGDGVAVYVGDRSFGISVHLSGARGRERALEESLARTIAGRL